jgi:cysteine desulfurase NifS
MKKNRQEKSGICGICSAGCGIIATYDKDKIISVRPDDTSPIGHICRIGKHSPEIIYSKNRLKYPLKRIGPKGSYDFKRISWDEAYNIIVSNLNLIKEKYGPEATAIYTGVGSFERAFCDVYQPKDVAVSSACSVLFPFGSPNTMGVGALCYVSYGMIAPHLTMGKMLIDMYNDIENSELIVVWGTNPATDLPPIDLERILTAKSRGAEIIIIDPRRTQTVKLSKGQWIPIRPGTDGALALGLCNIIIEEELYDEDFVSNWIYGFEEFSKYVQHFRPEIVEDITGVSRKTVVDLARKLSRANGACKLMYTGMEYSASGVQGIRASIILWALAGQLDVPGGMCFRMSQNSFRINSADHIKNPGKINNRIGNENFPIYIKYRDEAHAISLPKSVLRGDPYSIKSLILLGGSIITSWPNPDLWKKTLNSLDFLVCIDRQLTADSAYADIVLPASTYYEIVSYVVYGSLFKIRERMIPPIGESRSDIFIIAELARRLGYGNLYPQNEEELLRHALVGSGFTLEQVQESGGIINKPTKIMQYKKWEKGLLRKDGKPGFDTPTGKLEIYSTVLEEYGYDPLPKYTEPPESPISRPDIAKIYPLVFNSGSRTRTSIHTQHHGVKSLNKNHLEPTVLLNSLDATERKIKNGQMVQIRTLRGAINMRAIVTDDIVKGAIDANHACGSPIGPKSWKNTNVNVLTDIKQFDPISGFPIYKSLLCEVEKIDDKTKSSMTISDEISEDELKYTKFSTPKHSIYLDYNATTPLSEPVKQIMKEVMEIYSNPSSVHKGGKHARSLMETARRQVAQAINCTAKRIIFTGSGSEANNLAIKGVVYSDKKKRKHIITSKIEHPSVIETCKELEKKGFAVTYLDVDSAGRINPDDLSNFIDENTALVSLMMVNNITGVIQPITELVKIAHKHDVPFHTDAVQAFGKIELDVSKLNVDLLTLSAHKIQGPKGVGALYRKKGVKIEPLIAGGGQEFGLRSGTENLIGIVGFGKAAEYVPKSIKKMDNLALLRDFLEEGLSSIFDKYFINGVDSERVSNTSSVTLPGFRGESILLAMSRQEIFFSSGSACSAGSTKPSYVLLAMGLTEEEAHCSLRFSLSIDQTKKDIEKLLAELDNIVKNSKNIIKFVPCR